MRETEQLVHACILACSYPIPSPDPWTSQREHAHGGTEQEKRHLLSLLLRQPTGSPIVGCLPRNPSERERQGLPGTSVLSHVHTHTWQGC